MNSLSLRAQRFPWHRWIRRVCFAWAVVSLSWLAHSYRTRGVAPALLASDATVTVCDSGQVLAFLPATAAADSTGLVFLVGAGVAAEAYAPLLRPIAERGFPVHVIRLPFRIAPLELHKRAAVDRALTVLAAKDGVAPWGRVEANEALLPRATTWVAIEGGNHSQFAHYGRQLFDGAATISRERQQSLTQAALLAVLEAQRMP